MNHSPCCPICTATAWRSYGTQRYSPSRAHTDEYLRVRRDVLFQIWFPRSEQVAIESVGCERCGFFCYRPRPEVLDLDAKYAYINSHQSAARELGQPRMSDARRARELYSNVRAFAHSHADSVLDYGGGNGRLLTEFQRNGYQCHVIDYVDKTLNGVHYAGPALQPLIGRKAFDVITCNHVLEHLAEPVDTLATLSQLLATRGVLYVEVPSEIWLRPPPKIDPVTHINFFTVDSLRTCLESAGLHVQSCRYAPFTRPNGLVGFAIKAVASRPGDAEKTSVDYYGLREVDRLLRAGLMQRVLRVVRHPRMLFNIVKQPEAN